MTETYECTVCGGVFEKGWTDDEAMEESKKDWGDLTPEVLAVVCDVCYRKVMGLPPEEE